MISTVTLVLVVVTASCSSHCPVWTTYNSAAGKCECGTSLNGIVHCDPDTLNVSLTECYCMTYNEKANMSVVGPCIVMCDDRKMDVTNCDLFNQITTLDSHLLNSDVCGRFYRTGQLCSKCIPDYGLPVYSYRSLKCTKCLKSEFHHNLIRYLCVAFLPLTVFYAIIITFKISITSDSMIGYILISQLYTSPMMVRYSVGLHGNKRMSMYLLLSYLMIWNLDFFRTLYPPFCIHPHMSTMQVLALDYLIAVYPLLLIFLTYIVVILHDRYSFVVRMCRPLYRVSMCVRRKWNIRGSLVQAFAAFLLLSYVKILNVSFDLLFPVQLKDVRGEIFNNSTYLYNDAEIVYFGKEHIFYAILAMTMLTVFNLFPAVLLLIYPSHCFQKCLNKCGVHSQTLHTFMDAFQGCYRHQPRDCRYFAGLYLCLRVLVHCTFLVSNDKTLFMVIACYFTALAILLILVEPYKKPLYNKSDSIFFILSAVSILLNGFNKYLSWSSLPVHLSKVFSQVFITIVVLYGAIATACQIIPQRVFTSCRQCFIRKKQSGANEPGIYLPYRLEQQEKEPLLKN